MLVEKIFLGKEDYTNTVRFRNFLVEGSCSGREELLNNNPLSSTASTTSKASRAYPNRIGITPRKSG